MVYFKIKTQFNYNLWVDLLILVTDHMTEECTYYSELYYCEDLCSGLKRCCWTAYTDTIIFGTIYITNTHKIIIKSLKLSKLFPS